MQSQTILCVALLAVSLVSVFAGQVREEEHNAQALIDVDKPLPGFENVGDRQARQFGYGGYGGYNGYRGGYGGYGGYGGFGRYRGGYGGYGGYRGGFGGYGPYFGYRGGFYG